MSEKEPQERPCPQCLNSGLVPDLSDDGSGRTAYCDCEEGLSLRENTTELLDALREQAGLSRVKREKP